MSAPTRHPVGIDTPAAARPRELVKLPYRVATLLYCFNEQDEVLLLERAQAPNRGLWSPCGGKLHTEEGESYGKLLCIIP